jgi:hypothetical protein
MNDEEYRQSAQKRRNTSPGPFHKDFQCLSLAVAGVRIVEDRLLDIAHADIVRRGDHGVVRGKLPIERDVFARALDFATGLSARTRERRFTCLTMAVPPGREPARRHPGVYSRGENVIN